MNKVLFCFWTENNTMSQNRIESFNSIKQNSGLDVKLITNDNLPQYILPHDPLPKCYTNLSAVHKSDFLRTYFMHYYGGGYCDIKCINNSWIDYYNLLNDNENIWIVGYKEIGPQGVAHKEYTQFWQNLIGNGAYICRSKTLLTTEWYQQMKEKILELEPLIIKYPAAHARDKKENYNHNNCYPVEWNEILGRIFHPLIYKYRNHVNQSLPMPIFKNYQ